MGKTVKDLIQLSSTIEQALIESNGELTPDIESMIMASDILLSDKADQIGFVMKRLEAGRDFYKQEYESYKRLSNSCEAGLDRMKSLILVLMDTMGKDSIEGAQNTLKRALNPGKNIVQDESMIPEEYKTVKTETVIDKRKLAADLKAGLPIPGVIIERDWSLKVQTSKLKELK